MNLEDLLACLRERMEDGEYATAETFLTDMAKRGGGCRRVPKFCGSPHERVCVERGGHEGRHSELEGSQL